MILAFFVRGGCGEARELAVDAFGEGKGVGLFSRGEHGAHGGRQALVAVVGHEPVQRG